MIFGYERDFPGRTVIPDEDREGEDFQKYFQPRLLTALDGVSSHF